ncbi:MAG TPA: hypothetical protein VKB64_00845 [Gaiellaceae bacterium]|nr:hypothetical protein [Gaiellaceae bacterium]
MSEVTWTTHSAPRRRLALAFLVPALAAAAAATSLILAGSAGLSSRPPVAAVSASTWTPFASPWAESFDLRDLKRQLARAGYRVMVDDRLDAVTRSAFADYLRPGTESSLGLARALRGTVLLGRQNPVLWNRRFGLNRTTKFVERPLTGPGGQLDANGNIRDPE